MYMACQLLCQNYLFFIIDRLSHLFGNLNQSVEVINCHSVVIFWQLDDYQMTIE